DEGLVPVQHRDDVAVVDQQIASVEVPVEALAGGMRAGELSQPGVEVRVLQAGQLEPGRGVGGPRTDFDARQRSMQAGKDVRGLVALSEIMVVGPLAVTEGPQAYRVAIRA